MVARKVTYYITSLCCEMSLLYQVRHFIRFCQISGAIPYSMELVKYGTRRGSKTITFEFSWRQPTAWWFTLIISSNLISPFVMFACFNKANLMWDLPNLTFVIVNLVGASIFLLLVSSRYMILQPRKWNRIIRLMYKLGATLDSAYMLPIKTTKNMNCQVVTSVFVATGLVLSVSITSLPGQLYVTNSLGPTVQSLLVVLFLSMFLIIVTSVLIFHFSYLILSQYFATISSVFLNKTPYALETDKHAAILFQPVAQNEPSEILLRFEKAKILLDTLSDACSELNSLFSLPVFVFLTTAFVNTVVNLYLFILSFVNPSLYLSYIKVAVGVLFSINLIMIFVLLYSSEMPIRELRRQREFLIKWQSSQPRSTVRHHKTTDFIFLNNSSIEDIKMTAFLTQMKEERFRLSALGLFDVGLHLIPSLTGAVVTYLVILIQQARG